MKQVKCYACSLSPPGTPCHECGGKGYTEVSEPGDKLPGCTGNQPVCPIVYDPMVHGWECDHCGDSGPA